LALPLFIISVIFTAHARAETGAQIFTLAFTVYICALLDAPVGNIRNFFPMRVPGTMPSEGKEKYDL
jgi:hypothetical protein